MTLGADDQKQIDELYPPDRELFRQFVADAKATLNAVIFEGYRSLPRQKELYAQGRTMPGDIVTNSQPGYSYHQYGLSIDLVFDTNKPWGKDHPWAELGKLGESYGLEWGGSWKYPAPFDRPHFQLTHGWSIQRLYAEYEKTWRLADVWATLNRTIKEGAA